MLLITNILWIRVMKANMSEDWIDKDTVIYLNTSPISIIYVTFLTKQEHALPKTTLIPRLNIRFGMCAYISYNTLLNA